LCNRHAAGHDGKTLSKFAENTRHVRTKGQGWRDASALDHLDGRIGLQREAAAAGGKTNRRRGLGGNSFPKEFSWPSQPPILLLFSTVVGEWQIPARA